MFLMSAAIATALLAVNTAPVAKVTVPPRPGVWAGVGPAIGRTARPSSVTMMKRLAIRRMWSSLLRRVARHARRIWPKRHHVKPPSALTGVRVRPRISPP